MVLPLLGILGLGAAAGLKPSYDNWAASQRGDYNQSVMQGIDPNDPSAMAGALFGGGLLSGSEYQSDTRGAYEGLQSRQQSDMNSRRAAGSAAASLAERQRQFNLGMAATQMQQGAETEFLKTYYGENYNPEAMKIPSLRNSALQQASASMFGAPVNPVIQQGMDTYGPQWGSLDPETRMGIANGQSDLEDLKSAQHYLNNTTVADRKLNPATTAEFEGKFNLASIPAMLEQLGAGAPQEAELALIDKLRGDPFGYDLVGAEKATFNNMITRLERAQQNQLAAYGLNAQSSSFEVPGTDLTPQQAMQLGDAASSMRIVEEARARGGSGTPVRSSSNANDIQRYLDGVRNGQ